ncbi:Glycosyl hydrolase, BNR repeat precursor [Mesoflavibacter sp. HG96]|uniref:WD40/YVTN/BNR-like repeat-containing protein n=1 Tax=Mesoflavibacter TaxID=444051 RepID=UPI000D10C69C|nr:MULTISPECIES: glycosyl hydrolase [Mesoflavibacter]QIJ88697.1 Glycosyl hydrolase, BNR repeat precursor [Mesoflavibacter sp. HG96]QIJ91425.1 Glycosyl hydrolase, BNR repeat precursor [Mesoflavibacter sp. HG37]
MRLKLLLIFIILYSASLKAQQNPTSKEKIKQAVIDRAKLIDNSLVKNIQFENIGPTVMSGRVVDLAVNPENPTEFYVGYASGGVWHTTNNGTSFTPILDNTQTQNVGDIAVDWKTRTIWVGTGENNASRSSYAGIGLLKSSDNGQSWQHVGLSNSQHVGRILINPNNPDEVVVGVTGSLYSKSEDRGIYKTKDGGKTWTKTLYIDEVSGIIDVQHSPNDYNIMFASSWTKDRKAWNFDGSGNNSAIYKSTDAGETWQKVSTDKSGFPTGNGVGRIGLAVYDNNIVYAIHDSQFRRPSEAKKDESNGLKKDDFKSMSTNAFLKLEDKKLNSFLKTNGFQEKYRAENVKQMVRSGNVKPADIATYLEDANSMLFDTPVIGAEVYKSTDGGLTWQKTHDDYIDDLYYSYGYYFGHIYVSPADQEHLYIYGVPILKSKDGGKTFVSISAENVHADHHALWINPKQPNHLINGNDGGVNVTYDDGETWIKNNTPAVGQFYAINVDNQTPYNVYGGLQDNGVWKGANNAPEDRSWQQYGQYPWEMIMGGDGMQIEIDNRNPNIVYTGYQFGNYYRLNLETKDQTYIQPKHQLGESPYRFNWQTPIELSSHNQDVLYLGGNKLMRSLNQGNTWEAISDDLTNGGKKGNVAYGTLTSISESPFQFGLIYTGSDDGLVHVTKNGGATWEDISSNLPKDLWVSRVIASSHKKERVYVTLNGYRWDHFNTYVYKSEDYGKTWINLTSNLPMSPVNVIKEDPVNSNLLYLGTDNAAYLSLNQGKHWELFSNGLPAVAVHDLVIQKETNDLLIATHGRSIYKTNMSNIQKFNQDENASQEILIFDIQNIRHSSRWGTSWSKWQDANTPNLEIQLYSAKQQEVTVEILSENNSVLNTFNVKLDKGFNALNYGLNLSEKGKKQLQKDRTDLVLQKANNGIFYLPKGDYVVKINKTKKGFKLE